jgi:hypothetical protein
MIIPTAPTEKIAFATVRIEADDAAGMTSTGTGFFFAFCKDGGKNVPAIVTNRHVLSAKVKARFILHGKTREGHPSRDSLLPVELVCSSQSVIGHPDPTVDLCVVPIAPLLRAAHEIGREVYFVNLERELILSDEQQGELTCVEDVLMVGYPNGLWDSYNNMPIMRRGVTATHPAIDYTNKKEFMIDAACFPGSSGSPIFLYNSGTYASRKGGTVVGSRIALLGVLYAGPQRVASGEMRVVDIPTAQVSVPTIGMPINLGLVIKASRLLEFEDVLRSIVQAESDRAEAHVRVEESKPISGRESCPCGSGKPFRTCHGDQDQLT